MVFRGYSLKVWQMGMRAKEKITTIDFYLLQKELISNIRGEESQVDLSKNLGYSFNKIAKWESATNKISWNDFLAICSCKDISLEKYFKDKFNYSDSLSASSTLIFYMVGSIPLNELASTLQISRAKAVLLWYCFEGKNFVTVLRCSFYCIRNA